MSNKLQISSEPVTKTKYDSSKVTRFEVIDHRPDGKGRILVAYDVSVVLDFQDDRRTLKVFLADRPGGEK